MSAPTVAIFSEFFTICWS